MTPPNDKQPIPITLTLHVDAAAAVRAGKSTAGPHTLRLTEADLAELTDAQRETLARHVAGAYRYAAPLTVDADPIACADVATLAVLLDARAAYVAERDADFERANEADIARSAAREALSSAFGEWLHGVRGLPIADLLEVKVPPEHADAWRYGGTFPVSTLVGRREEAEAYRREQDAAAELAERAPVLALLGSIDPELADLYRAERARDADVTRALRRWLRAQTGAGALPQGWRGAGIDDADPIAVPISRAARLWAAHAARVVWPEGVAVRVSIGWAYRPADSSQEERGDEDAEVCEQAIALVLEVGDEQVTAHVCPDALPPAWATTDPLAVQRRILAAVRDADPEQAARIARAIVDGPTPAVAAVLAATRDPAVRDALAQLWQIDELEGRGVAL